MPNGGTDCCMNCAFNRANHDVGNIKSNDRFTRIPFCTLRSVAVFDRAWTYCRSFSHKMAEGREPIGPIFANGQWGPGYQRVPWYGLIEPRRNEIKSCLVCGLDNEKGISLFEDDGQALNFCSNDHYSEWVENNPYTSSISEDENRLLKAAEIGDSRLIDDLLSSGVNVNAQDDYLWTPLHWAAMFGHTTIVRQLLDAEADIDSQNLIRWTPTHCAAYFGNEKCVLELVNSGVNLHLMGADGMRAVDLAGSEGFAEIVSLILEGSYSSEEEKEQALLLAAQEGHLETVVSLINNGVNIETADRAGWTPLLKAVYEGHVNVSIYLLDHGANINAQNKYGYTPFSITNTWKTSGMEELKSILISRGAQ
jgi:ankyrin repeat protein